MHIKNTKDTLITREISRYSGALYQEPEIETKHVLYYTTLLMCITSIF